LKSEVGMRKSEKTKVRKWKVERRKSEVGKDEGEKVESRKAEKTKVRKWEDKHFLPNTESLIP